MVEVVSLPLRFMPSRERAKRVTILPALFTRAWRVVSVALKLLTAEMMEVVED
jgi:hypothetical protein